MRFGGWVGVGKSGGGGLEEPLGVRPHPRGLGEDLQEADHLLLGTDPRKRFLHYAAYKIFSHILVTHN